MKTGLYLFQKEIDWSALNDGINIPVCLHDMFYSNLGFSLKKGEQAVIQLMVNGEKYPVKIININFDQDKYPLHKDLLQLRYGNNSPIARVLKLMFKQSYDYLLKNKVASKKCIIPEGHKEYLVMYSTDIDREYFLECITSSEFAEEASQLKKCSEVEIENIFNGVDTSTEIKIKTSVVKIRRLSASIGNNLKLAYDFKCQICGNSIGDKYDEKIAHAHHIEPFIESCNNNASNIMIICPNHHSVIHAANPIFDKSKKQFTYPNGYQEKLTVNLHL